MYLCSDGRWLGLTVTDDDAWRGLTSVLGRADLAKDERLADVAGRQAAHDELDDAIGAWSATVTADAAFHALQAAGVAAAPCADDAMLATDPQIVARRVDPATHQPRRRHLQPPRPRVPRHPDGVGTRRADAR